MDLLSTITANPIINAAVIAWFTAQLLKLIFTLVFTREFRFERLIGSGGMPSAHSAFVCAAVVVMGRMVGLASPLFGIAFCFAAVVIYDAMGVRRAAGEQAKVLNRMIFEFPFFKLKRENQSGQPAKPQTGEERVIPLIPKQLKELLGHTPFEVLGGCLLGLLIGMIMPLAI